MADSGTKRSDVVAARSKGRDIEPQDYYVALDLARTLERETIDLRVQLAEYHIVAHEFSLQMADINAQLAALKLELATWKSTAGAETDRGNHLFDSNIALQADLARVTRERDEARRKADDLRNKGMLCAKANKEYVRLKEAAERACEGLRVELAVAIKGADSWFDECRGIGECPGLDVGRKLLAGSKPRG